MCNILTPTINAIGGEKIEHLVTTLLMDKDVLIEAVSSNTGIARWFKGFIQSDEFSTLSNEQKGNSFELFTNLETIINILQENLVQLDAIADKNMSAETAIA